MTAQSKKPGAQYLLMARESKHAAGGGQRRASEIQLLTKHATTVNKVEHKGRINWCDDPSIVPSSPSTPGRGGESRSALGMCEPGRCRDAEGDLWRLNREAWVSIGSSRAFGHLFTDWRKAAYQSGTATRGKPSISQKRGKSSGTLSKAVRP